MQVRWSVVGQRSDGVAFERGGSEDVQITSTALTWSGVSGEATIGRNELQVFGY